MRQLLKISFWTFLITSLASNCLADTKFHYGDKVKFHADFYGDCHGRIESYEKSTKLYSVEVRLCNGLEIYSAMDKHESELTKDE